MMRDKRKYMVVEIKPEPHITYRQTLKADIMNNKKIFLANLSKGQTGEMNSSLIGLILVSKMQMAAMKRGKVPEEERKDFYLYIDEFQNFTTDSIATILSEARKYRLNLSVGEVIYGHQVSTCQTHVLAPF